LLGWVKGGTQLTTPKCLIKRYLVACTTVGYHHCARGGVYLTATSDTPEKDELDSLNTKIFIKTLIWEVLNR
jgi:hypothetical protein